MIPRYTLPEMAAVFSDTARFGRYLEIELLATEAHAALGIVPKKSATACRSKAPTVDADFVAAVEERERITDHDVAAFVDVVQARIGAPHGAWIHYGLTSSDVVDTAWCWMMRDACTLLLAAADDLLKVLVRLAREHRDTVMIGRTHGIHAEPTTFGAKVALWALLYHFDWGEFKTFSGALYFSLASFTTVGANELHLSSPHRMVGALESAAGMLMFGWSTALLVKVVLRSERSGTQGETS